MGQNWWMKANFCMITRPRGQRCVLKPLFILIILNHLESVKDHFSSILTKFLPTNGRTNGRTKPLIEMRGRSYKRWFFMLVEYFCQKRRGTKASTIRITGSRTNNIFNRDSKLGAILRNKTNLVKRNRLRLDIIHQSSFEYYLTHLMIVDLGSLSK